MSKLPVVAVTPGEPAGIGPDLCLRLAGQQLDCHVVLIADADLLQQRAALLDLPFDLPRWNGRPDRQARVYLAPIAADQTTTAGRLNRANAGYVLKTLERAVTGCLEAEFDALVTGPVHKGIINDAGIAFTGHTEFLAERSDAGQPVMLLTCPGLRVALATIHLPLAQVSRHITRPHLLRILTVLHHDLRSRFAIPDPVILVCGLNPHAGEGGHLGREEIDVIGPVIGQVQAQGWRVLGPVPADTAFLPAQLAKVDAVLAMYHDQGLPVIKHHDFAHAVNVTLGLPFIRTSVDHGTALELAGTGQADPSSLQAALQLAVQLARHVSRDV
jgi:4-hydroxythreonine-4-phosphate dehydrogenase